MHATNLSRYKGLFILLTLPILWLVGLSQLLTSNPLQSQSSGSADLTVTINANPNPVNNNKPLVYSIIVRNQGVDAAASVTVTEYLPVPYVGYVSCSATGGVSCTRQGNNILQVVYPTLFANSTQTITVETLTNIFTLSGTQVANDVEVFGATFDPNVLDNSATVTTTIQNAYDLTVAKVVAPNPVLAGSSFVYTVTARNLGPSFQIKRPKTYVFSNLSPIVLTDAASGTVGMANLYPSSIPVTVPSFLGEVVHVAVGLHDFSHDWPEDVDMLLVGPAGISVTLMSDAGGAYAISNAELVFDDNAPQLPRLTQISSGTYRPLNHSPDSESTRDTYPNPGTGDVIDKAPYLGRFMGLNSLGKPDATGIWRLYAIDDSSGNTGSIAGGWTLSITVMSSDVPITLTDVLPVGSILLQVTKFTWSIAGFSGNVYTYTRNSAIQTSTLVFSATAPVVPGIYPSLVTVKVAGDHVPSNNQHSTSLTVLPDHDLAIEQTVDPARIPVGAPLTYTLIVSNFGPSPASNPSITSVFPSGVVLGLIEPSQGTCHQEAQIVYCEPGLISNDSTNNQIVVTIHGHAPNVPSFIELNAAIDPTADRQPLNNSASQMIEIFVPEATVTDTPPTVPATVVDTPTPTQTPTPIATSISTPDATASDTPTPTMTEPSATPTPIVTSQSTLTPDPHTGNEQVYLPVVTR